MGSIDILGFGAVAVDDLLYVKSYPAADTKKQVLRHERHCGGLTATALVAAALILQSITGRPDIPHLQQLIHPEEAVKLGADAIAVSMFLKGPNETDALRILADTVFAASRYDLPVITHVYPRLFDAQGNPYISNEPDDIAYVVRCGIEAGADVVKVPYCGDIASYRQIVSDSTVPIVAAGGPKTTTMLEALQMMEDVIKAGARGATVGRNIWGSSQVVENALAYKAVIHDLISPAEAVLKYRLE